MSSTHEWKARLRQLRDQLASEEPRLSVRAHAPAELAARMRAAAELVGRVYLLVCAPSQVPAETLEEVCEDAIVEGHLVLHDWERWLEQDKRPRARSRTPPPIDRRQYARHETKVSVRLLRHDVGDDGSGGVALASQEMSRPARNLSLGGIFVAVTRNELPQVTAGSVVRVSVSTPLGPGGSFQTRAAVARRDDAGLGLRWIEQSDRFRRALETLLAAVAARA